MAKIDLFDIYEKNVKAVLEPCVEEVNNEDLFELDESENKNNDTFDISDDVLEKLAQRVAGIMKEGDKHEVNNE